MISIHDLARKYPASLTDDQKDELYQSLKSFKPGDLKTIDDHRVYIETVAKLRKSLIRGMRLMGDKFLRTLESLLSVGEDGVYSNGQRFIYELIQNVDDCDYTDTGNCNLEIEFRYENEPGRIIFTYNEVGFTPANVFAITGIAEASKNITPGKVEIGEKGIGFKSVFGIADKVLIESGQFAFELQRNNFTVPVPRYEHFQPVQGTRMTLFMDMTTCRRIYRELANQYVSKEAILNRNPILFLNKLTHLKIFFDGWRSMEFDVSRNQPVKHGDLLFEDNAEISVNINDYENGREQHYKTTIHCYRYSKPIVYGIKECQARYGADTPFTERHHQLVAIFPVLDDPAADHKGVLYSFLPTQIKLTVPLILHVPFKLDGSREFVDSHQKDAWFTYTLQELSSFLDKAYIDLAGVIRQKIIHYLPQQTNYLFLRDNEKVVCLLTNSFLAQHFLEQPIFYTEQKRFQDYRHIVSFVSDPEIPIPEPGYVFSLLNRTDDLFIPDAPVDMEKYGVRVIDNLYQALFSNGLRHEDDLEKILTWLETSGAKLDYESLIMESDHVPLSELQLAVISHHKKLATAFLDSAKTSIKKYRKPSYTVSSMIPKASEAFREEIMELVKDAKLNPELDDYLNRVKYAFYTVSSTPGFIFPAGNGIIVSKGSELSSFSQLAAEFEKHGTFSASLKIRQASQQLNNTDDTISNKDYLRLLQDVRKSIKDAYGKQMYGNYIQLISQAGSDKKRFFSEVLQNADDCKYPDGVIPSFSMETLPENSRHLRIYYNETGFTKQNVRAITAIGESTKKRLMSGSIGYDTIGEKGVGFKSVFGVAESVEIHSNGFDFMLSKQTPTIPVQTKSKDLPAGTEMIFSLSDNISRILDYDSILDTCLCLRNLRRLDIMDKSITIEDTDENRTITINGKKQTYKRFIYEFEINNPEALLERRALGVTISSRQKIIIYLPPRSNKEDQKLFVYNGLPTNITSNVPLIIDAPFELTTSRESITVSKWNTIIRDKVYAAIIEHMKECRAEGLDVLRFVKISDDEKTSANFACPSSLALNDFDWISELRRLDILPVIGETQTVSAGSSTPVMLPDFMLRLPKEYGIQKYFPEKIVNTLGKNKYMHLLELIGCKRADLKDIFRVLVQILKTSILSENETFRKGLYKYLSQLHNEKNQCTVPYDVINQFPIFPVKRKKHSEFISFPKELYFTDHSNAIPMSEVSANMLNEYNILDTSIMDIETADQILLLGSLYSRTQPLSEDVFENRYRKKIITMVTQNPERMIPDQIAAYLLDEYENNYDAFKKCFTELRGYVDKIPMLMSDGEYRKGCKFLNPNSILFDGDLLPSMTVDDTFADFGKKLGLCNIEDASPPYDFINVHSPISDQDISDLENLSEYISIITWMIEKELISEDQIERFHLEFGLNTDDPEYDDGDFPSEQVRNPRLLARHIKEQRSNPNRYVERSYTRWEPSRPLSDAYVKNMYATNNSSRCFCQMCREGTADKYIEIDSIEREPAYAWEQTRLCLCLPCSKDYKLLRNNPYVWNQFLENIMAEETEGQGYLEIKFGHKEIAFTGKHLAEIQEIFRLQGWGENAPKRSTNSDN